LSFEFKYSIRNIQNVVPIPVFSVAEDPYYRWDPWIPITEVL